MSEYMPFKMLISFEALATIRAEHLVVTSVGFDTRLRRHDNDGTGWRALDMCVPQRPISSALFSTLGPESERAN